MNKTGTHWLRNRTDGKDKNGEDDQRGHKKVPCLRRPVRSRENVHAAVGEPMLGSIPEVLRGLPALGVPERSVSGPAALAY